MASKEQTQSQNKSTAKQRFSRPEVQKLEAAERQIHPAAILQRVKANTRTLTPGDVLQLQRTMGNQAVGRLLTETGQSAIQRQPEEEEEIQLQPDSQPVGLEGGKVPPAVESAINRARGGGQPLEYSVQEHMSETMGYDFSRVRVHTGSESDDLNQQLSAKAFTTGRDIFFKQGEYNPGSSSGQELIAHELSHVVQQRAGRVVGTGGGMTVRSAGDVYEQEANGMAKQATSEPEMLPVNLSPQALEKGAQTKIVQRRVYHDIVDRHQPGDLIYGIALERQETVTEIRKKYKKTGVQFIPPVIMDDINNLLLATYIPRGSTKETWEGINKETIVRKGSELEKKMDEWVSQRKLSKQYQISQTLKNIKQSVDEFMKFLESMKNSKDPPLKEGLEIRKKSSELWEKIKKLCQAGIAWTISKGKKIYFILDGLDQEKIVTKRRHGAKEEENPFATHHSETGVYIGDITGAELRWIYRNWVDVNERVSFWKNGINVSPPWQDPVTQKFWLRYKKYSQNIKKHEKLKSLL